MVGSWENEVHGVNVIREAVARISSSPDKLPPLTTETTTVVKQLSPTLTWSHQVASGSFSLNFLDNYTNVYERVQNIAVKVDLTGIAAAGPTAGETKQQKRESNFAKQEALLVNCHFDTPLTSPGDLYPQPI